MRIFVVGYGVVARSFVELLESQQSILYSQHGLSPRLVGVCDSRGAAVSERGLTAADLHAAKESTGSVAGVEGHGVRNVDASQLIAECDADVVVEASPSQMSAPARSIENLKAAFRTGKHAVSVNKAPLAAAMPAMMELADFNKVQFRFSGTVGGGTPVLNVARECARGDEVQSVRGIFNGTTNFILWKMHEEGLDFDTVLTEAIELGYAETDPSADIDGIDAATKVVILANYVLGRPCTIDDVKVEGIRGLPRERIEEAADRGNRLKLIGEIGDTLSVSPQEVPAGDPLDVPASLNAITLTLKASADVTLIGRGAGGIETATSVMRDLLDIWNVIGGQP